MPSSASISRVLLAAWLRVCLLPALAVALALAGGHVPLRPAPVLAADSTCPAGLAGKFVTTWDEEHYSLEWYKFFGEHTFAAADVLHLSFAVVPAASGTTSLAVDEIDGRTGYSINFQDGLVNNILPYMANSWNIVKAEFNFDTRQYSLSVNGVSSGPLPFDFGDSNSAQAFRVNLFGTSAELVAWFDSIKVVKSSAQTSKTLFAATFDDGATYPLFRGSITPLDPPDTCLVPAACTSEPMFVVSPTSLTFHNGGDGSGLNPQLISIHDNGVSPVSWTVEESLSWLSLSSAEGVTPAQIEVSVAPDGLEPGVYAGQITLHSDDVGHGRTQTVGVSLTVYSGSSSAGRPCPAGLAGRAVTGPGPAFQWYLGFGEHTFAVTNTMRFSFAVVPFEIGITLVALDDVDHRTAYQMYFYGGKVYGEDHGNHFVHDTPLGSYLGGKWNYVQADYNFATHQYMLNVNGVVTGPFPFSFDDANSAQALRVHSFNANETTFAWLDSIAVARISEEGRTELFAATFDDGVPYSPSPGTITPLVPPGQLGLPAVCESKPMLIVAPDQFSFSAYAGGGNPDLHSLFIADNGQGALSWNAGEGSDWLSLSRVVGVTPAEVQVGVDVGSLAPGEYHSPITVFSSMVTGDPQTVDVRLLVHPAVPITLTAEAGYDNIRLDWNPTNNPYVTAYRVLRAVGLSPDFVEAVLVGDPSYLDDDPVLVPGTEYCYRVAALGADGGVLQESDVACAVFGRVELWIPDTWAAPAQTVVAPLNIRNATGLSIAAGDIWLNFDGAVIELLDVSETPLTQAYTWSYAIQGTGAYSQARISAMGGPAELYGSGSLFWLTFRVLGSQQQESPLDLQEFVQGVGGTALYTTDDPSQPVPLQLQDGVFQVADGSALGDLNGNGAVQAADAYVALQIASGEATPFAEQLRAGDDNGSGTVESADASMILYYAAFGSWPMPAVEGMSAEDVRVSDGGPVVLSLDDIPRSGRGGLVQTTLRAENLVNWAGGEFLIVYDPGLIDGVSGVEATGLGSAFVVRHHEEGPGLLRIALADGVPVTGSGALATIALQIASDPYCLCLTPLNLAEARLNDVAGRDFASSALQQAIVRHNGELQIGSRCYFPLVLKSGRR